MSSFHEREVPLGSRHLILGVAPVKFALQISTSPSSSVVLSAETQRFAVTDSHPYAFSFSPTPSEYGSNFKSWREDSAE